MKSESEKTSNRKALRDQNRATLIRATLDSIAESGFSGTSVSAIIDRAELSRGMIHLHFGGKDKLLEEAARHSNEAYFSNLEELLSAAGTCPQDRIAAVINSDLSAEVLNGRSVRIWYAFRGEARNRAEIGRYSDTRDDKLRDFVLAAFEEISLQMALADARGVARDATHGTLALLEGMWTDFLLHPTSFNRASARRIVFRFLGGLYPGYFTPAGPVSKQK